MALRRSEEREGPMRGLSKPKHFQNSLHFTMPASASKGRPFGMRTSAPCVYYLGPWTLPTGFSKKPGEPGTLCSPARS